MPLCSGCVIFAITHLLIPWAHFACEKCDSLVICRVYALIWIMLDMNIIRCRNQKLLLPSGLEPVPIEFRVRRVINIIEQRRAAYWFPLVVPYSVAFVAHSIALSLQRHGHVSHARNAEYPGFRNIGFTSTIPMRHFNISEFFQQWLNFP